MACVTGRPRMAGVFVRQQAPSVSPSTAFFSITVQRFRARGGMYAQSPRLPRRVVCRNPNATQAEATEAPKEKLVDLEAKEIELNAGEDKEKTADADSSTMLQAEEAELDNNEVLAENATPDVADNATELSAEGVEPDIMGTAEEIMSEESKPDDTENTRDLKGEAGELEFVEQIEETMMEQVKHDDAEELRAKEVELNGAEYEEISSEETRSSETESTTIVDEPQLTEIQSLLRSLKEAVAASDEEASTKVESQLQAIQEERDAMLERATTLSEELPLTRDYTYRLSMEFESYRRAWEQEQLTLTGIERAKVIESLLPMLQTFEQVKNGTNPQTEVEQKIANSYGGIERQFVEIMKSLGAVEDPVVVDPPLVRARSFFTRFWDQIRSLFPPPSK